jgi:hypothetical protein
MDACEAGGVDAAVPIEPVVNQVGRADRAVVARGVLPVGGEPLGSLLLELLDGGHRSVPALVT